MKTKLNLLLYTLIVVAITTSCSTPRNASAQSDYPTYDNTYSDDENTYTDDEAYGDDYAYNDNNYNDDYNPPTEVDINVFYNELSPYGRWVDYPSYGRVWICNERDFLPYQTRGHWVYTSYGWTWVSGYRWGWAPFHYGRWAYDGGYGWMWVPGYEWGPAWVSWRSGGDYYGWAPMSPGLHIGIGFGNYIPTNRWYFAPRRYITKPYIGRYCLDRVRNVTIIKQTNIINNTNVYNNRTIVIGPRRDEVEKYTGHRIQTANIVNSSKPGQTKVTKNTVQLYKPEVKSKDNDKRGESVNANTPMKQQNSQQLQNANHEQLGNTNQRRNRQSSLNNGENTNSNNEPRNRRNNWRFNNREINPGSTQSNQPSNNRVNRRNPGMERAPNIIMNQNRNYNQQNQRQVQPAPQSNQNRSSGESRRRQP